MNQPKRILIVGGVAGGASAAARARRLSENADIVLFERGEYISFANCGLPYHIGGTIQERKKLIIQTPEQMSKRFRIDIRTQQEVIRIDREKQEVTVKDHANQTEYTERYDHVILSPGAQPVRPPLPGIDLDGVHVLRTIPDMDAIMQRLETHPQKHAAVVGGGYIGLEAAEALRERGVEVSLIEMAPQVMGPADPEMAAPLHEELKKHGVNLLLQNSVSEIQQSGTDLNVILQSGQVISCGLVLLSIGVKPENRLAKEAGLELGALGGIAVNDHMQTSDPNIYAVGDAVEVTDFVTGIPALIPLAGPANRQGRIAADHIFGRASQYKQTQGTAICKVFDLAIGMTGASEKNLKRNNIPYETIYVHHYSHTTYYPGAVPLTIKLLFEPESGKVLGAQSVAAEGVDKRIDVLAVAIRAGLTVFDLEEMELCYAPPFGSAKDPINYAGFVAANMLRGDVQHCHSESLQSPSANQFVLDVRTPKEFSGGQVPGAVNLPLDDLRERVDEIPKDKEILVYCQAGLRGYIACRILFQHGFNCRNMTGGYKTYKAVTEKA